MLSYSADLQANFLNYCFNENALVLSAIAAENSLEILSSKPLPFGLFFGTTSRDLRLTWKRVLLLFVQDT